LTLIVDMRCVLLLISMFAISKVRVAVTPTADHLSSFCLFSLALSRPLEEDRGKRRDEMQDTTTEAFKAVAIFGYYFAVRANGADKTVTRQADTERTSSTSIFPHFFCRFCGILLRSIVSPPVWRRLTGRNSSSHAMRTSTTGGRDGARA
jgi:hypothetical protein